MYYGDPDYQGALAFHDSNRGQHWNTRPVQIQLTIFTEVSASSTVETSYDIVEESTFQDAYLENQEMCT